MSRNWAVASQQDRDRCRQCALLPAGRGTVTIAAARLLRCRRAREHYPCVTTGSLPRVPVVLRLPGRGAVDAGGRRGARRGGAGGRRPRGDRGTARADAGAMVSRLLRMIPAREDIPEEEQLGWITARLADPASTGARRLPILGPADEAPAHRLPPRHLTSARCSTWGSCSADVAGPGVACP